MQARREPARVRQSARLVATASVRAARHPAFSAEQRASTVGEGRADHRVHEDAVRAVRAARLSTHPHSSSTQGHELSWSRTHRLWRQAGCCCLKGAPGAASPPGQAQDAPALQGQCGPGVRLRLRNACPVIDECTRECLAISVAGSIRSKRVIKVLSRLVSVHGAPLFMRSGNGPEFVNHAILEWIAQAAALQRRPPPQLLELLDPPEFKYQHPTTAAGAVL